MWGPLILQHESLRESLHETLPRPPEKVPLRFPPKPARFEGRASEEETPGIARRKALVDSASGGVHEKPRLGRLPVLNRHRSVMVRRLKRSRPLTRPPTKGRMLAPLRAWLASPGGPWSVWPCSQSVRCWRSNRLQVRFRPILRKKPPSEGLCWPERTRARVRGIGPGPASSLHQRSKPRRGFLQTGSAHFSAPDPSGARGNEKARSWIRTALAVSFVSWGLWSHTSVVRTKNRRLSDLIQRPRSTGELLDQVKRAILDVREILQGPRRRGSAPDRGQKRAAGARRRRNLVPPALYHVCTYAETPENQHPSRPRRGP